MVPSLLVSFGIGRWRVVGFRDTMVSSFLVFLGIRRVVESVVPRFFSVVLRLMLANLRSFKAFEPRMPRRLAVLSIRQVNSAFKPSFS